MLQAHPTDPTLVYFDVYSHGEPIRMLFAVAKKPFVDKRIPMEEWPALKASGQLPFGSLPVVIGGQNAGYQEIMCQKLAILRGFGSMFGYYPKDSMKSDLLWRIDSVVELCVDSISALAGSFMTQPSKTDFDVVYKKTVSNWFKIMDARLSKNPTGCPFAAGTETPTIADFYVVSFL